MGKGDRKTAKGKRVMGSYGNTRKKKVTTIPVAIAEKPKKEVKVVAEKPVAKKAAPKKETNTDAPKKATVKKTTPKKEA
jgi:30S ribosomal protein S31